MNEVMSGIKYQRLASMLGVFVGIMMIALCNVSGKEQDAEDARNKDLDSLDDLDETDSKNH